MADRGNIREGDFGKDGHYIGTKNEVGNMGEAMLAGGELLVGPETVYGNPGRRGRQIAAEKAQKKDGKSPIGDVEPMLEIKEETSELDIYIELARCFSQNLRKETIVLSDAVRPGKTHFLDGCRIINRDDWDQAMIKFGRWVTGDLSGHVGVVRVHGAKEPSPAVLALVGEQGELPYPSETAATVQPQGPDLGENLSQDGDDTLDLR